MPLETGSGARLAVFQETVHHAAFPGVYKGDYRRGLLVVIHTNLLTPLSGN